MAEDLSPEAISGSYSVGLAQRLLEAGPVPFGRIIEHVNIDHGQCARRLTMDWHLPEVPEVVPWLNDEGGEGFADGRGRSPDFEVIGPILLIRRGALFSSLKIQQNNERLYVCSREESQKLTYLTLLYLWEQLEEQLRGTIDVNQLALAKNLYLAIPAAPRPRAMLTEFEAALNSAGVDIAKGMDVVKIVHGMAEITASSHIIWVHLNARPGQAVRLHLSYKTRFAAEYPPMSSGRVVRVKNWFRRWFGQEPFELRVPITMHGLSESYHFEMPVGPVMYVAEQRLAFQHPYDAKASIIEGEAHAGGPTSHMYVFGLPALQDNEVTVQVKLAERPPGATAAIAALVLITTALLFLYMFIWKALIEDPSKVEIALFFVALPGLAAIWFSRVFQPEVRPHLPLLSRFAIFAVGFSSLSSLLLIVIYSITCHSAEACPAWMKTGAPWSLRVLTLLMVFLTVWLYLRRIAANRRYRKLQEETARRMFG